MRQLKNILSEWRRLKQENKLKDIIYHIEDEQKKIRHCNKILAANRHWIKSQARTLTHFLENLLQRRLSNSFVQIKSVIIFRKELVVKLFSKFGHANVFKEKKRQALGILREFNDIHKLRERRVKLDELKEEVKAQNSEIVRLNGEIGAHSGLKERSLALNFIGRQFFHLRKVYLHQFLHKVQLIKIET
jgi:hypothetical protein